MTAPPREPSVHDMAMLIKRLAAALPHGHDLRESALQFIRHYGLLWSPMRDAAPAPSADQDQNGGQGHEAYVHCSLGALPLESGNAREATCLNTEPSARTGTDTQQGQLGANAGSIPAPPTSTPAAQPAAQRAPVRVPCPNKVDGVCPLPNVHCAYPKCTEGTAPLSHVTPAGPPAPRAQAATDDLVARLSVCAPSSVADDAIAELQRHAREIARWNELHRVIAEELDCEAETWPDHRNAPLAIGATFVLIKQRADRAEAERDAMRECVRELVACADESDSLAAERLYGKPHTPEYKTRELDHRQRSIEAWKAARAKVR